VEEASGKCVSSLTNHPLAGRHSGWGYDIRWPQKVLEGHAILQVLFEKKNSPKPYVRPIFKCQTDISCLLEMLQMWVEKERENKHPNRRNLFSRQ
jgi:hypothetical protein